MTLNIKNNIPLLETILEEYRDTIGSQFAPYRNHVYRVLNYCFAFHDCVGDDEKKLVISACFHDLGIWPDDNVDYLPGSIALAKQYLSRTNQSDWAPEISRMIDLHHRFRSCGNAEDRLVEVFRKGDWVDATMGWRRFGLNRNIISVVAQTFPNLGFHKNLMRLATKQFFKSPLNPLPMMKW